MQIEVSRAVAAPPERVWSIMTDLAGWPEHMSGIERVERLDSRVSFDVGTRWEETRTVFGRSSTERMEVTALEPGTEYSVTSIRGDTTSTATVRVTGLPVGASQLTMIFAVTTTGAVAALLGATLGRLFRGATRRMLEVDLADIAAAAERSTS